MHFPIVNPQICTHQTCKNISITPPSHKFAVPFQRIFNQMNYQSVILQNEDEYLSKSSNLFSSTYLYTYF